MQLMTLLHKVFKKGLSFVHQSRFESLMTICSTAVKSNKIYLTGLGRELSNRNKVSSNIQKVDRLLGNKHLQKEREFFYKVMIDQLIPKNTQVLWIHIDWSCINSTTNLYVLRASLSMSGRSIVIYEECHPKKKENNHVVHKVFLNKLKELLPPSINAIIVTDAGFRSSWFEHVLNLGWDFVGRLRNKNLVQLDGEITWKLSSTFFEQATGVPSYVGHGKLTKGHEVAVHLVLYLGASKNRHKLNKNKKISCSGKSKRYSKAAKEPWLLVTSLPLDEELAKLTTNIYRQRMRIEENIRDTKSYRYGFGLKMSLSRSAERMGVLLLISAISTFAAWLAGLFVTQQGRAADFQSHSAKMTNVLSKVYLGREAFKKGMNLTKEQFNQILKLLQQLNAQVKFENVF